MKFCLLTLTGSARPNQQAEFVFFAHKVEDLTDPERGFTLSPEDIELLNPNTRTCPIFRSKKDAELTKYIYRRVPVLIREARNDRPEENPWGIKFATMFHMSNDSGLFRIREQLETGGWQLKDNVFYRRQRKGNGEWQVEEYLPLYEAKMLHQFDHRFSSFKHFTGSQFSSLPKISIQEHANPHYLNWPQYWVSEKERKKKRLDHQYFLSFRGVVRNTDIRTSIAALLPSVCTNDMAPLILTDNSHSLCGLLSILNSFILDYCLRNKTSSARFSFFMLQQLPFLSKGNLANFNNEFFLNRVLELTYTAWDLEQFALDCGYDGPPFRWDEERRFLLRCELDAAFFHLYLGTEEEWKQKGSKELLAYFPTPRHAVDYIMETFPIVKRKDEAAHDHYRTKDTILEIYDALAEPIRTGQPYQTRLDPPPGPPVDAQGKFIPMADWDPTHWPSHIHPLRANE